MSEATKVCRKCGETKALTEFHKIAKDSDAAKKIVTSAQRRYLMLDDAAVLSILNKHREYKSDVPRELIEAKRLQIQLKRACKPPVVKSVDEFVFDLNAPKNYRPYCKACLHSYNRAKEIERIKNNTALHTDEYYQSLSGNKKCNKCKAIKDVKDFNKNRGTKDGLNRYCADCTALYKPNRKRAYQRLKKDEYRVINGMKKCRTCKESRPVADYPKKRRGLDGLDQLCKYCKRARLAVWINHNRDAANEYAKKYRNSLPTQKKEELLQRQKKYYKNAVTSLSNSYIRKLLEIKKGIEIPQELLEAKRTLVKLNRRLKDEDSNRTT